LINKDIRQEFDLAVTHLRNKQNISAYNQFLQLAEKIKKTDSSRTALLYALAAECKTRQEKDSSDEILESGKKFLEHASSKKNHDAKMAYLCAAKCFFRINEYDKAEKAFTEYKKIKIKNVIEETRPIVLIEDSKAMMQKIKTFLQKMGYNDIHESVTGKDSINIVKNIINSKQNPVVLLDIGLPDMDGDEVASSLLKIKIDLPIVIITADEKSSEKVHKIIAEGATAFIQKPFSFDELKNALSKVESEELILKQ